MTHDVSVRRPVESRHAFVCTCGLRVTWAPTSAPSYERAFWNMARHLRANT